MPDSLPADANDAMLAEDPEALEIANAAVEPSVIADTAKRPDITPAQIVAMIPLLAEFGHAFGIFSPSGPQQDSLSKLVTAGIALFGADALIRLGRNLARR